MASEQADGVMVQRFQRIRRREAGLWLGGAALSEMLACSEPELVPDNEDDGRPGGAGGALEGTDSRGGAGGDNGVATRWASGGTSSISDEYPPSFTGPIALCHPFDAAIAGPCTEAEDRYRRDISEAYRGLPLRLLLRVLDRECVPLVDAKIKVWHTQRNGSYSGETPANSFCLFDPKDSEKHYFRGAQRTDDAGVVLFHTCFPGWYPGRTIHIHFSVEAGEQLFSSQLYFDDALTLEIFERHPDYQAFGMPDTPNAKDFGGRLGQKVILETRREADGVLTAQKTIVLP